MDIRAATPADRPAIRDVARRSLQASYTLGPQAITSAIEEWYDEGRLEETLADDHRHLLVAEVEGQVVAFSESVSSADGDEATLLWLHVDPDYRGRGIADDLFERTRDHLAEAGAASIQGRVLADNTDGNAFYESHGFEQVGHDEVEIDGRTHTENVWVEETTGHLERVEADGRTVYVAHDESDVGSVAEFNVVYTDEDRANKYGYYCSNCGQLANAMDSMGRIECDNCGNTRKPARWDAAYL